ncbi:MAG TPA: uroporphyrinogen-III C-methyltransferase, partial [Allocoleopsis sp.]
MNNDKSGKVYIVGAGIGKIDYLTVKAYSLLTQAEILIYDALVNTELLTLVPNNCIKIDVGKRGGKPSTPQTEINKLLVEYCQKNKIVVRLKSGDPFIFGRTISEIQTLITAKCNWEIVPGISSVMAAPLLAGIPLTDTVLSRCFVVFTGHEINDLDWENI